MTSAPLQAAVYVRVSTREQNPEMQTRDLDAFCAHRDWRIFDRYTDHGVSGARESRPELNRLLADSKKRKFNVVVVWKFDRFARSVRHLLEALELFQSLGIHFVSYTEGIDTTTPAGKLIFTVLGAVAELERGLNQERVRAGIANARAKGQRLGRPRNDLPGVDLRRRLGWPLKKLAKYYECSVSTVKQRLRELEAEQRRS